MSEKNIRISCKGKHRIYSSRPESEAAQWWKWAVRCVRGEDGKYHAFESEDDYRAFKKLSPTNYR